MKGAGRLSICCVFFVFIAASAACNASLAAQLHAGDLIVLDPHNQQLPGNGVIIAINPTTGAQTLIAATTMLEQSAGIAMDPAGNIVVSDYGYSGQGGVFRVDPATGTQSLVSTGDFLSHPTGVAVDSAGNIIVVQHGANQTTGAALRIDPASGNQTVVSLVQALAVPDGLTIDANGDYLVANFQGGSGGSAIVRVDAGTGAQSVVSAGGDLLLGPSDVWVNNLQGDSLLVTHSSFPFTNGRLIEVNTVTGDQTVISAGGYLAHPTGVTQDAFGNVFVADFGGGSPKILRIDPLTGQQTIISTGGYLSSPVDILVYAPEPGSFALLATAAAIALVCRVKRRLSRRFASDCATG
jgi:streptogramin lyase